MGKFSELWIRTKGKATKPVADAAGDRRSEAKARLEAESGHKPDESTLEAFEHEIRRKHGDVED